MKNNQTMLISVIAIVAIVAIVAVSILIVPFKIMQAPELGEPDVIGEAFRAAEAQPSILAPKPKEVLVVYNNNYLEDDNNNGIKDGKEIAEYYIRKRGIPKSNICIINAETTEEITRDHYNSNIKSPLERCLVQKRLKDSIRFIVLTKGVPLKIKQVEMPMPYSTESRDYSSVDAAVALLYQDYDIIYYYRNPYFGTDTPFFNFYNPHLSSPWPDYATLSYLVTRLDAFTVEDVLALVDRAINTDMSMEGEWVIDDTPSSPVTNYDFFQSANAALLGMGLDSYISYDNTPTPLLHSGDVNDNTVIAWASHGEHDPNIGPRSFANGVPDWSVRNGAVFHSMESFNGGTFLLPVAYPQNQLADWIQHGGSGGIGHVYEPMGDLIDHPDIFFARYASGYTLAEAAYMSIPYSSWQLIVVGDPLMQITQYPDIPFRIIYRTPASVSIYDEYSLNLIIDAKEGISEAKAIIQPSGWVGRSTYLEKTLTGRGNTYKLTLSEGELAEMYDIALPKIFEFSLSVKDQAGNTFSYPLNSWKQVPLYATELIHTAPESVDRTKDYTFSVEVESGIRIVEAKGLFRPFGANTPYIESELIGHRGADNLYTIQLSSEELIEMYELAANQPSGTDIVLEYQFYIKDEKNHVSYALSVDEYYQTLLKAEPFDILSPSEHEVLPAGAAYPNPFYIWIFVTQVPTSQGYVKAIDMTTGEEFPITNLNFQAGVNIVPWLYSPSTPSGTYKIRVGIPDGSFVDSRSFSVVNNN